MPSRSEDFATLSPFDAKLAWFYTLAIVSEPGQIMFVIHRTSATFLQMVWQ